MPHAHGTAATASRNRLAMVLGLSLVILVVETADRRRFEERRHA
jgi:hypothetical protein